MPKGSASGTPPSSTGIHLPGPWGPWGPWGRNLPSSVAKDALGRLDRSPGGYLADRPMKTAQSRAGYPGVRGQKVQCDQLQLSVVFTEVPAGYAMHTWKLEGESEIKVGLRALKVSPRGNHFWQYPAKRFGILIQGYQNYSNQSNLRFVIQQSYLTIARLKLRCTKAKSMGEKEHGTQVGNLCSIRWKYIT